MKAGDYIILGLAAVPAIYYVLVLYSTIEFFSRAKKEFPEQARYTPPVSCLKPVRGLDVEAYENFASFCRQNYPEYEILFCVDEDDPAVAVIKKLMRDFPDRTIRLLYGSRREAINDKVARLVRLVGEAQYEMLVIADADVRVQPNYLRAVVAPFRDPKVGGATCLYVSTKETSFIQRLHAIGMSSDFFAGIMVAWKLDGVKFAFGQTIVARRQSLAGFGGYQAIENRPADDLLVGRLIAEQGYEVKLLPHTVEAVADFSSMRDLMDKRVRWMTVMRGMRPWGHLGLIFTWGLPWALLAIAVHPTAAVALAYLGGYMALRIAMTWLIGIRGLKESGLWSKMALIPLWDAVAFLIWLISFGRKTIRWRGIDYYIDNGTLVPVVATPSQNASD